MSAHALQDLSVPVHRPKQGPLLDPSRLKPGVDRPNRAGLLRSPVRDPNLPPGLHLVGLALSDPDDKPFVGSRKVIDIKAYKLAPPHGARKAKEEKRPVPDTEEGAGEAVHHVTDAHRDGGMRSNVTLGGKVR